MNNTYASTIIVIIVLFCSIVNSIRVSACGFSFTENDPYVDIPFKYIDGMIIIPVRIDGGEELNFILDTGIRSVTLFDNKYAKKIGLKEDNTIMFSGVGNRKLVHGTISHNRDIHLPSMKASGISVIIIQEPIEELALKNIHGGIGYQIFAQHIVKIDYSNRVLTVYNENAFIPDPTYEVLPIKIHDTKPYITNSISVNGRHLSVRLMIDTGFYNDILLFKSDNIQSLLSQRNLIRTGSIGIGLGGSIKGFISNHVNLKLKNTEILGIQTFMTEISPAKKHQNKVDGLIGNNLMENFIVVLDYINMEFHFKPNEKYVKKLKKFDQGLLNQNIVSR